MQPANHDIDIWQGDTFQLSLRIKADGVVVDITDWQWSAQVRATPGGVLTVAMNAVQVDPVDGRVDLVIAASETAQVDAGSYVYDVQAVQDGNITTYLYGEATVHAEITRG